MKNFTHSFLDHCYYYSYLGSTMQKAKELVSLSPGNFLVIASRQRYGTGRKDQAWFSPQGGLWFTLGIYGFQLQANFTLFLGIILHKAILNLEPELRQKNLQLKWPNDIYLDGKKLAGTIVRHIPFNNYYLCGCGINTNFQEFPADLADKAISLEQAGCSDIKNEILLREILDILSASIPHYITSGKFDYEYYRKFDFLHNKEIILDSEFTSFQGKYAGLNQDGALILKMDNNALQPFYAGSVSVSQISDQKGAVNQTFDV